MTDVFISYASDDRDRAETLASAFEARGWSVWWDRRILTGQAYDQAIEHALGRARCVVVLWSLRSVASEWVRNEAAAAAARGVLLPAIIERVEPPLEFRRRQTADMAGWDGDPSHSGFEALCAAIASIIGGSSSQQPRLAPRSRSRRPAGRTIAIAATGVIVLLGAYTVGVWQGRQLSPDGPVVSGDRRGGPEPEVPGRANPETGLPRAPTGALNLLAADKGGHLLLAPRDAWKATIDGKEDAYESVQVGEEAVYGFDRGRAATFDAFGILIPGSGRNPKELELLAGNESPAGVFRTITTFHPQNAKVFPTGGWQEITFPPVTAKYFKVKLRSNHQDTVWIHPYEFRLMGRVERD